MYSCKYIIILQSGILIRIHVSILYQNCGLTTCTGEKNYYLLTPNFSFIKKDKIDYDDILKGIYISKSDLKESFEEIELYKIHSNYDNDNDDDNDDN